MAKATQAQRDQAARAYLDDKAKVQDLMRRYGVSRPAVYQWIAAYKSRNPEAEAAKPTSAPTGAEDLSKLTPAEMRERFVRLYDEHVRLKKRLFELMVETGKI
jgi:transposase-like protein